MRNEKQFAVRLKSPPHSIILKINFNILLPSVLTSTKCPLSLGFTTTPSTHIPSHRTCQSPHHQILSFLNLSPEQYRSCSSTKQSAAINAVPLHQGPNTFLSALFSHTLSFCSSPSMRHQTSYQIN